MLCRVAARAGAQTLTAHFAAWEAHSRGIASKLMAAMGYVPGNGLGRGSEWEREREGAGYHAVLDAQTCLRAAHMPCGMAHGGNPLAHM